MLSFFLFAGVILIAAFFAYDASDKRQNFTGIVVKMQLKKLEGKPALYIFEARIFKTEKSYLLIVDEANYYKHSIGQMIVISARQGKLNTDWLYGRRLEI